MDRKRVPDDRQNAMFTKSLRPQIRGEGDVKNERDVYKRVRERVYNTILDAHLLAYLPEKDRRRIFHPNKNPKVTFDREITDQPEETWDETLELEFAVEDMLAFLYLGISERPFDKTARSFDDILREALDKVARYRDTYVTDFEFTVQFEGNEVEQAQKRFEDDEASLDDATLLLQSGVIDSEEFQEFLSTGLGRQVYQEFWDEANKSDDTEDDEQHPDPLPPEEMEDFEPPASHEDDIDVPSPVLTDLSADDGDE